MGPTRLSEYPWVIVNVSCKLCARRGRYRLARLASRYGPEIELDILLAYLARNCRYWNPAPRKYETRCGARFEDLDRLRPEDLPPEPDTPRQRAPAREDVPQRRRRAPEPTSKPPMLSDWTHPEVIVACEKCGRRDVYATAELRAAYPNDRMLTYLRSDLTADCPRVAAQDFSDWCAGLLVSNER